MSPKRHSNNKRVRFCSKECSNRACYLKAKSLGKHWSHRPKRSRVGEMKRLYNTTPDQIELMRLSQNNCCALCGLPFDGSKVAMRINIDHDHNNGKIRGLLHTKCNGGLGMFNDSTTLIRKALDYLLQHEQF